MGENNYTPTFGDIKTTTAKEPEIQPMITITKEQYDSLHRSAVILDVVHAMSDVVYSNDLKDILAAISIVEKDG